MRFEQVSVLGVAHIDAPIQLTSREIEDQLTTTMERLGVAPGLLEGLSGIHSRRFWPVDLQPSDAATMAAELVLEQTGLDRDKIGVLVNASVCRDYIEPSTASLVHGNLRLSPRCLNFDVGNACLGFLDAMQIVANMIATRQVCFGIIVDGEGSRHVVERTIERLQQPTCDLATFRENFATLTLGSGAAAMILCHSSLLVGQSFTSMVRRAATEFNGLCRGQEDGMVTDTKRMLLAGLDLAAETYELAKVEMGWAAESPKQMVVHQVSKVHTERLSARLDVSMDSIYAIYPEFGNIGPASVPIVLSKILELERVVPGDRVGLMGIGSGINCAMAELVW